jgi:hypothetical protein
MTDNESSWIDRINEERSIAGNYVLNGTDRIYCITGDTPDKTSKSDVRGRIKKDRIQNFPLRFQDLFDDIALIEYSDVDFVTESEWEKLWKEIIDINTRKTTTLGYNLSPGVDHESEFQFGAEMGSSIRALRQADGDDPVDLIWGFIVGMCGLPIESSDKEVQNINEILENLHIMNDERYESLSKYQEHIEKDDKLMSNVKNRVERAFEINDIDPEHIPYSKIELWREMFRLTELGEDIYDKLDEVINIDQLKKSIRLKDIVEKDIQFIEKESFRYQYSEPIIKEIWNNTDDSERIHFDEISSIHYDSGGKKLLNQFSIPGKHKDELQDTIIEKNGNEFKLNDYGKLLAFCMFEEENTDWILKYMIIIDDPNDILVSKKLTEEKHNLVKNAFEQIDLDTV